MRCIPPTELSRFELALDRFGIGPMTRLLIEQPQSAKSAETALETIVGLAGLCGDPVWTILQSFEKLAFLRFAGVLPDFEKVFSGRIFGPGAEVRWTREGPEWTIWRLSEDAS